MDRVLQPDYCGKLLYTWPKARIALKSKASCAIIRLAAGSRIPVGGVGGVAWVDAGTDPRMRGRSSHHESLRRDMRETRRDLEKDGWLVAGQDESWAYCLRGVKPSAW